MKEAKILFFPNVAKKSLKTNLIPIYLRVSRNGVKAESNLNVAIEEKELRNWDEVNQIHNSKLFPLEINPNLPCFQPPK
jgi:actin-related protein